MAFGIWVLGPLWGRHPGFRELVQALHVYWRLQFAAVASLMLHAKAAFFLAKLHNVDGVAGPLHDQLTLSLVLRCQVESL